MQPEAGTVVASRYVLERELAKGGMGSVWVARHLQLDVPVAIKFMFDAELAAPSGRARFLREARAAARLRSPHVVRVYDYEVADGTPYIAMEMLEGESLDERIRRQGRIDIAEVASILRQLAKALGEAHELGIVHRDLKPSNIFLARAGEDEVVKVLDFGIAKETMNLSVEDKTESGVLVGSPHHMSPEQARGGQVDARSDLWCLGVVLFECVAGERPFTGANIADLVASICMDEIPTLSALRPEQGPSLDRFFEKALARNPAMRFQSAREMASAFEDASRGLPTDAGFRSAHTAVTPSPTASKRRSSFLRYAMLSVAGALVLSLAYLAMTRATQSASSSEVPVPEDSALSRAAETAPTASFAEPPRVNPPVLTDPPRSTPPAPNTRKSRTPPVASSARRRPEEDGPFF